MNRDSNVYIEHMRVPVRDERFFVVEAQPKRLRIVSFQPTLDVYRAGPFMNRETAGAWIDRRQSRRKHWLVTKALSLLTAAFTCAVIVQS